MIHESKELGVKIKDKVTYTHFSDSDLPFIFFHFLSNHFSFHI